MTASRRTLRDLATVALMASLLGAVYLLPPDTALREIRERGMLGVCIPAQYPPLVTGEPERPGLDVELVKAVAERIGVAIQWHTVPAMGRDFNPRAWRLTRAQCQIVAGGVVDTPMTRSFLDVTRPHAETGWVAIEPAARQNTDLAGRAVGVLPGSAGIDRLALSRYLRANGISATVVHAPADLAAGLADGRFAAGITDSLIATGIAADHGWTVRPLSGLSAAYPLVFGLWKGDLTLKRAVDAALSGMEADGTAARISERYLGRREPPSA